jgi:benzoate-CoA ligase
VVRAGQVGEGELKDFVKTRLAPYKYPRWIEFVDELPRTATGKVQRYQLRS